MTGKMSGAEGIGLTLKNLGDVQETQEAVPCSRPADGLWFSVDYICPSNVP